MTGESSHRTSDPGRLPSAMPDRPAALGTGGELRAVLFDMDGLLVDSEPLWFEAERSVMARMGGP